MKYKISVSQLICVFYLLASLPLGIPHMLIYDLGRDFWLAVIIAVIVEVTIGWFLYKMGKAYLHQTIFHYSEQILGKYLGKLSIGLLSVYFISVAVKIAQGYIDFFGSIVMPETPKYVLALLLLLVSTYACYAGIEVIVRLAEMIAPFVIGSFLFIMLFNLKEANTDYLRPVFQHDVSEVIQGSMLPTAWIGTCIIMGFLMAYHNNPWAVFKAKLIGVGLGTFTISLSIFFIIMVIGVEVSARQIYSVFVLARFVSVGDFIERLEAFQLAAWTAGGFLILALFQYAGVEGVQRLLPKKSRMFINWSIAGVIFIFTVFLFPTTFDKVRFLREIFVPYGLAVELGVITLLFICHVVKEKYKAAKKRSAP